MKNCENEMYVSDSHTVSPYSSRSPGLTAIVIVQTEKNDLNTRILYL